MIRGQAPPMVPSWNSSSPAASAATSASASPLKRPPSLRITTPPLRSCLEPVTGGYGKIRAMKSHRSTGRPRGRPPSLPFDLDEQVLCDLESRMDTTTFLVTPSLSQIARRLKVSRASIKRVVARLRNSGYIELCCTKKRPTDKIGIILYKLLRHDPRHTNSVSGA